MAYCKDCLHYPACEGCVEPEHEANCCKFTDKSEWVHLPCKFGSIVFSVCDGAIVPFEVVNIEYETCGEFSFEADFLDEYDGSIIDGIEFRSSEIGKDVFLTENEANEYLKRAINEEAEKALERKEK